MYGYRQYAEAEPPSHDWISKRGRLGPATAPPGPWLYQRAPRYPVYRRFDPYPPGWYPPGHVQMYGRPAYHHLQQSYYPHPDELYRSSSAHLPVPPPADYAWDGGLVVGRPARRTQSSVQARSRRPMMTAKMSGYPPHQMSSQRPMSQSIVAGFASRFFNDRHALTESGGGRHQRLSNQMLVEPPSLHRADLIYSESRKNDLVGLKRKDVAEIEQRPYHDVIRSSSNESLERSASPGYLPEEEKVTRDTYRIVSELLPRSTQLIHEAILESAARGGAEVILDAGQLRKHSRESSCTCYQCQEEVVGGGRRKHSSASLVHDENFNLTIPTGKNF